MNANELVEYMKTHDYSEGDVKNLFDLVDEQQAEIEALKAKLAQADRIYDFDNPLLDEQAITNPSFTGGLDTPVAWINDENIVAVGECPKDFIHSWKPLYTHPAQELNDGGEPVKNATYWKRQHDRLLMNLNVSAIKIAELEKELAILRKAQKK